MRKVEQLTRSIFWSESDQEIFRAAVRRCRTDDKRLRLCDQKAHFLTKAKSVEGYKHAIDLLTWVINEYPKGYHMTLAVVYTSLGGFQEAVGDYAEAAESYQKALPYTNENAQIAVLPMRIARALLRANHFVATDEVLAMESLVLSDKSAESHIAYHVGTLFVVACCAKARGQDSQAGALARKAISVMHSPPGGFERVVMSKGVTIPLNLLPEEYELLTRLAGN